MAQRMQSVCRGARAACQEFSRCSDLHFEKVKQVVRKVAFIGLGTMGKPMAMNIAKAGFGHRANATASGENRRLQRSAVI
jgi:6-phosphogluconate dehydrogenase-like protein